MTFQRNTHSDRPQNLTVECFCPTLAMRPSDIKHPCKGNPSTRFILGVSALYTLLLRYSYITTTLTMTEISKFIPELSSICKIYSGVISGSGVTCEDTLTLVAFINSFPSVHEVESGIMDLVLKAPTEHMEIILKSLYTDLDKIVTLYKYNSIYYDRRDLGFLWDKPLCYTDKDIEAQQKKTKHPISRPKPGVKLGVIWAHSKKAVFS